MEYVKLLNFVVSTHGRKSLTNISQCLSLHILINEKTEVQYQLLKNRTIKIITLYTLVHIPER